MVGENDATLGAGDDGFFDLAFSELRGPTAFGIQACGAYESEVELKICESVDGGTSDEGTADFAQFPADADNAGFGMGTGSEQGYGVGDQADIHAPHEKFSNLQTSRSSIHKNTGSSGDEFVRYGCDRFLFDFLALLALVERNLGAGIEGIEYSAVNSDQVARIFEVAQIPSQCSRRDTEKLLKFCKA